LTLTGSYSGNESAVGPDPGVELTTGSRIRVAPLLVAQPMATRETSRRTKVFMFRSS
jgi:hypothetical protein